MKEKILQCLLLSLIFLTLGCSDNNCPFGDTTRNIAPDLYPWFPDFDENRSAAIRSGSGAIRQLEIEYGEGITNTTDCPETKLETKIYKYVLETDKWIQIYVFPSSVTIGVENNESTGLSYSATIQSNDFVNGGEFVNSAIINGETMTDLFLITDSPPAIGTNIDSVYMQRDSSIIAFKYAGEFWGVEY